MKAKLCKHCKKFFLTLKRTCSSMFHGECDCPPCQGICGCRKIPIQRE